jgi:hypothetical protein
VSGSAKMAIFAVLRIIFAASVLAFGAVYTQKLRIISFYCRFLHLIIALTAKKFHKIVLNFILSDTYHNSLITNALQKPIEGISFSYPY